MADMALSQHARKKLQKLRRKALMAGEREYPIRVGQGALLLGAALDRGDNDPAELVRLMRVARSKPYRNRVNEAANAS